jgi:chaperonin cofactor prefoldin
MSLSNQEIIDQVKKDVELLEQRWNSFWDHDHQTLARQRYLIENLQSNLDEARQSKNGASVHYRDRVIRVREACSHKCEENEAELKDLRKEIKSWMRQVATLQKENRYLREKLADLTPVIRAGDAIQVIPPFEIFDHKNRPISALTVAREVRLAHQALHI